MQILLGVIAFVYLGSTLTCFFVKANYSYKNWLPTLSFIAICCVGLAIGFVYKNRWLGVDIYFVPSISMHPILKPGEFILVDSWAYQKHLPQKKDIVVFQQNNEKQWLVKRIATWPNGSLSIDGKYYLLGDNAKSSVDSRRFGGIPQEQIQGKVKLVLLSINAERQMVERSHLKPIQ